VAPANQPDKKINGHPTLMLHSSDELDEKTVP